MQNLQRIASSSTTDSCLPSSRLGWGFVSLLPLIHLGGCIAIDMKNIAWMYMAYVDFPASILMIGMAWRFEHPLFWFGLLGTLWWYLLSLVAWNLLRRWRRR